MSSSTALVPLVGGGTRLLERCRVREWRALQYEARARSHARRRRELETQRRYADALLAQLRVIDDQLRAIGERGLAGVEMLEAQVGGRVARLRQGLRRLLGGH